MKKIVSFGPWGGAEGHNFDDGVNSTIKQFEIAHGAAIDSLKIQYVKNGTPLWSEMHGGTGGAEIDKVKLDYPDEYLTSIQGYYGKVLELGPVIVRSVTFTSNKRDYGPYGIEQGTYFSYPRTHGKIIGFHGKSGWYLDAIGVHLELLNRPKSSNSIFQTQNNGYSMFQGSLGKDYDLILAIRNKDYNADSLNFHGDFSCKNINSSSRNLSRESSREFSSTEPNNKTGDLIPAKFERVPSKIAHGIMTYGPWGGLGGSVFDDGIYDGIRAIYLSRNVAIVSLQACYDLDGKPEWGIKNGGHGGYKYDKIPLNYPGEILTHISGYFGHAIGMGPSVIKSLTFHTSKGLHGPYGEEHGQFFSSKLRDGMVVGIHGRKGLFLDAIGVHVHEGKIITPSSSLSHKNEVDEAHRFFKRENPHVVKEVQRIVKDPVPYGPGPWGGDGGKPWDDGVFTGVKQIILTRTEEAICSIEIEYERNGQSIWSVKHGGTHPNSTTHQAKLEYPNEVVTCVSGYYGILQFDHNGTKVIKSLTFHTSKKKIGPIGEEVGKSFTSTTTEGKVVGFHGRTGMYLDAIGVHMQHWLGKHSTSKISSLKKYFS